MAAVQRSAEKADADGDGTLPKKQPVAAGGGGEGGRKGKGRLLPLSKDQLCKFMESLYRLTGVPAPCDGTLRSDVISTFHNGCRGDGPPVLPDPSAGPGPSPRDKDRNGKLSAREVEDFLKFSHFRAALARRSPSA
eukprot:gene15209-12622_t